THLSAAAGKRTESTDYVLLQTIDKVQAQLNGNPFAGYFPNVESGVGHAAFDLAPRFYRSLDSERNSRERHTLHYRNTDREPGRHHRSRRPDSGRSGSHRLRRHSPNAQ